MSILEVSAAKRRDFRNSKDAPEVPRRGSTKNRKKTCKKAPDKEHAYRVEPYKGIASLPCHVCVYCGHIELDVSKPRKMANGSCLWQAL
jgi:hypothetical protein